MASAALSHDDYTVAWISALPLEMAAAKVMLDENHDPLPQPFIDRNTYTLGRLCGHNIVIACLPSGIYGVTSAATVLTQMLQTFPSLRFGLMVGIGGGVPSKADIRLGDVVVSRPTATFSGVVQYDYGKTIRSGQFERIGSLNKPPSMLLTAIAQVESNHMMGKSAIKEVVLHVLGKNEGMRGKFSRPDYDWLFRAKYPHEDRDTECSAACDQNQLIIRAPRATDEPYIHYGLIASGNQVMKDAQTRDQIAQDLGILCFEMEAAGLMDQLPCLVIRGICDYCDSHKHKQWQGYASLSAAAYAKDLLSVVPVNYDRQKSRDQLWMVPFPRNPRFAGRQNEITKLEHLISMHNGLRIALTGLGGVGKTQIVLELVYRMRDRDPGCSVLWIPAVSHESIEQAYMDIAKRLELHDVSPADVKMRVKIHLSHENAGNWLLICDNADDTDLWVSSLKGFLPQSEHGHIVFTTRNRKLAQTLAPSNIIIIPEMDEQAAKEVLTNSLIHKDLVHDAAIATFLQQLTFLPLAITQAAAYINANGIGISEYLALLQEEQDGVELLSEDFNDEGRYTEIQNPVATTWLISFHQIQRLDSLAADYLSFMACINPQNIPQSLLPPALSWKKRTDALGLLNAYSFTSTSAQEDGSLSLHRLVHLATRNWMRQNNLLPPWTRKAADRFHEIFPNDYHGNRYLWREYLPHILFLIKRSEFYEVKEQYVSLLRRIAQCLYSDGRYDEAEVLFHDIIDLQQRKNGGSMHQPTLIDISWLASTYQNQGRWKEAEELNVQVMEIRKRILGAEHPDTLSSIAELATTFWNQGRCMEAEELEMQVMEIRKRILGAEHPDTLSSMNNLASTFWDQGRWTEAEELNMQVMEIRKRILGAEHPNTLISMGNLASIYQEQGRWTEAEELNMQVMEIRKRILGAEHPNTLSSIANLASTFLSQGRWTDAEELNMQVIEIRKRVLGTEHPDTLNSIANLALMLSDQGRWKEAEELGMQVMEIRKRVLGAEHPDTLISMGNLASTFWCQGRWKEAEELNVQVMEIRKRILGAEHPNTLHSMHNLACIWKSLGKHKDAVLLMTDCVQFLTQHLGPDHPHTIASTGSLSRWQATDTTASNRSPETFSEPGHDDQSQHVPKKQPRPVPPTSQPGNEIDAKIPKPTSIPIRGRKRDVFASLFHPKTLSGGDGRR
ncbi:putative kinesin [Talaromyces proteolyticus]|uniref:Kinesin n=1 Tax=Talaromyces proteolyticus TaxID=1131652 RepID=A0AAD4KMW8_9EURO|nr:putative kinesin [Talaromyces proteolyticus]KAH8692117.1 putative kinesin [Talaromyces proteolyticus]